MFCAIAGGKIPSKNVYEDGDSVAFLDIKPRSKGMTIVLPKTHYVDMHDDAVESIKVFQAAETVAAMIKSALGARFVEMGIIRSEEVPHFHIRLYPVYVDERPVLEAAPLGMSEPELDEIASKIRSVKVDIFSGPKEVKEPEGKVWTAGDAEYVRKQIGRD